MELVGLAVRHGDPDEQEFLGLSQAGPAEPFMRAPGSCSTWTLSDWMNRSRDCGWFMAGLVALDSGCDWSQFVNAELAVGNAQLYCLRDPATGADKTGRSRSGGSGGAAASGREKEAIQEPGMRVAVAAQIGLRAGNGGDGGESPSGAWSRAPPRCLPSGPGQPYPGGVWCCRAPGRRRKPWPPWYARCRGRRGAGRVRCFFGGRRGGGRLGGGGDHDGHDENQAMSDSW